MARNRGGGLEKARRESAREKLRVESARTQRGHAVAEAARLERRLAQATARRRGPPGVPPAPTPPGRDLRRLVLAFGLGGTLLAVALVLFAGAPPWLVPRPLVLAVPVAPMLYLLRARLSAAALGRAARARIAEQTEQEEQATRARVADEPAATATPCVECGEPVAGAEIEARGGCALCIDPVHAGACEEKHAARHAGAGATREGAYR